MRPGAVLPFDAYLQQWSSLHNSFEPRATRLTIRWLRVVYAVARPLARRGASPHLLTVAGVALAGAALVAADDGRPALAALLVSGIGFADGLDGAVAVLRGCATPLGAMFDRVADRLSDLLALGALAAVGAPTLLVVVAGVATMLHESIRAVASRRGCRGLGVVTVGERPTRLILGVATLAGSAIGSDESVATVGATALAAACLLGLVQLSGTVAGPTPTP